MINEKKYWMTYASEVGRERNHYLDLDVLTAEKVSRTVGYPDAWHLGMLSRMKHMDEARTQLPPLHSLLGRYTDVESKHWAEVEADRIEYEEGRN